MNKKIKLLILLFFLGMICGSSVTVYKNYKKDKKENKEEQEVVATDSYKVIRKNNKYTLTSNNQLFKNKELTNIFYDDKNIFLYLEGENGATLLKYNVEKDKVKVLYEDNNDLSGGITDFGNYHIIKNVVYDSSFKRISDFPIVNDNELLFPNLKYKLIKTDTGIIKKNIIDDLEEEYIKNEDDITYDLYLISNDSKTVILKKIKDEEVDLVYLDNDKKINKIDINYDKEKNYKLLTNKYLLEQTKENDTLKSNIYDITTGKSILITDNNNIYNKTNLVYKDDKDNVILQNYVTQEQKEIIRSKKEIKKFICSSDSFSLLLQFIEDEKSFYIIYL